jgi:hypothetical protein
METAQSADTSSPKSGSPAESVGAPMAMPRRLFHQHGALNRRKILEAHPASWE